MQELDFLQSINNKEILIEILHHSIDFLIGNKNEQQTLKLCHKCGCHSEDEFMLATRTIAKYYRNCCTEGAASDADLTTEFGGLSAEFQRLVPTVLAARRPEIMRYLVRNQNCQEHPLVESFDWDLRMVMGDSSYAQNKRLLTTCSLNCRNRNGKRNTLHFQMTRDKLDEFITELENAVDDVNENNKIV